MLLWACHDLSNSAGASNTGCVDKNIAEDNRFLWFEWLRFLVVESCLCIVNALVAYAPLSEDYGRACDIIRVFGNDAFADV